MKITLTESQKGYFFLTVGIILLLYTLGIFKLWFNLFFVFTAVFMILYGLVKTHWYGRLVKMVDNKK